MPAQALQMQPFLMRRSQACNRSPTLTCTVFRIASELLYKGFNVLLVGRHLEHVQKSLASSHSDRRIAVMSNEHLGHEDDFSIQTESLKSLTKMTTLVVLSSADPTLLSRMLNADNPVGPKSCLRMLQMILPGLRKDRPVAVVVAGGPLSFYSDEHVKRMDYYEVWRQCRFASVTSETGKLTDRPFSRRRL